LHRNGAKTGSKKHFYFVAQSQTLIRRLAYKLLIDPGEDFSGLALWLIHNRFTS
jgi:hypothetical protein